MWVELGEGKKPIDFGRVSQKVKVMAILNIELSCPDDNFRRECQ